MSLSNYIIALRNLDDTGVHWAVTASGAHDWAGRDFRNHILYLLKQFEITGQQVTSFLFTECRFPIVETTNYRFKLLLLT